MQYSNKLEAARNFERRAAGKIPASERLGFHLTPLVGWMNDPNGFCYYNGCYHLFYQYYPYDTVWDSMHWGHATTTDLLHWDYQTCALAPDTAADAAGCFSGSAAVMPDGQLMLMYTGGQAAGIGCEGAQAQCVAIGDGRDFIKDPANPVISIEMLPEGFSAADFRDPKVWYEDGKYYCVVSSRHAVNQGTILLFESGDGHIWKYLSVIDSCYGQLGKMWECPDFFPLDDMQVLLVNPQEMQASSDGEFHAGEGTVALLGRYDPGARVFTRRKVQAVDYGLDFYAPQTTQTPDGRRIMVAWMQSWATTHNAPRPHPWFGCMTLPRELSVKNGRLYQTPVREIETLWRDTVCLKDVMVEEAIALPGIAGRRLDLTVTMQASSGCSRFILRFAEGGGLFTEIRYDPIQGELTFDRSCCGSRRDIPHIRYIKTVSGEDGLKLRLILDRDCAELFINDGAQVLSARIDTPVEAQGISFAAVGGPVWIDVEQHML